MTNLLIYDPERSCGTLLRSYLRALGLRVSTSDDAVEARMKLDTGLFDGIVLVSTEIAPALGEIDASALAVMTMVGDRVEAILPGGRRLSRPRQLSAIGDLARRLRPEIETCPATAVAGEANITCRAADVRMPSLLLEPERGDEARFSEFFSMRDRFTLQLGRGEAIDAEARAVYIERNVSGAIERVAVRLNAA